MAATRALASTIVPCVRTCSAQAPAHVIIGKILATSVFATVVKDPARLWAASSLGIRERVGDRRF